ncbi:MAG: hypothetical protein ACLSIP_23520 [Hungatella sp.]
MKEYGKADPVNLHHFHKAADRIFCKIGCIAISKKIHVHGSVRKHPAETGTEKFPLLVYTFL